MDGSEPSGRGLAGTEPAGPDGDRRRRGGVGAQECRAPRRAALPHAGHDDITEERVGVDHGRCLDQKRGAVGIEGGVVGERDDEGIVADAAGE